MRLIVANFLPQLFLPAFVCLNFGSMFFSVVQFVWACVNAAQEVKTDVMRGCLLLCVIFSPAILSPVQPQLQGKQQKYYHQKNYKNFVLG